MKNETSLIHHGESGNKLHGAVVPPIFQNSLFTFESWEKIDEAFSNPDDHYIYTRGNNPTVEIVESKIAKLCHGERAKMFSSGMGAISAAIMHCVKSGDHIVTINNVYGPASKFISEYLNEKCNISSTFVEGKDISEFESAIQENTTLIYLESPSSVVFSLQDLEEIANLAKEKNIKTIIDNTWATPIYQQPLKYGIDLEIHSCSKYIGGHSDVVSGIVIGNTGDINQLASTEGALFGAKMAPFEAWLILRSLRTLPIRLKQHSSSTEKIIKFLKEDERIEKVIYPGDKEFDQRELAEKQMSGYTGLFSFTLKDVKREQVKTFVNSLNYFQIGVSWGGHESLIYAPAISLSKELTTEQFERMNLSFGEIRVSVGLEHPDDLIKDLKNALDKI